MSVRIFPNKQPNVHEAIDIYCNLGWGKLQDYNFEIWKKAFDILFLLMMKINWLVLLG